MSNAAFNPNMPVVFVQRDWSSAANVKADLEDQWGIDFGNTHAFTIDMWEGPSDSDDFGSLVINAGTPTMTHAFSSVPELETIVFILDIYFS